MKRSLYLGGTFLLTAASVVAASLPLDFTEALVATGLASPTAMAFAPDGRLFVCQQTGQLRVIKNGSLLATPFLTVTVDSSGERGLLGVAFDPNFAANQFVYIYYTVPSTPRHNRISRFTANGDVAAPGSESVILDLNNLSSATNHNGGAIHFGPDGKLYAAVGENANGSNSQTLTNLLGKILRLNPDGTVLADNPFYSQATGNNRMIWALGLRNPFTFAFQNGTGRMFVNDVGQSTWEEINDGIAGSNYGWPDTEGPTSDSRFRSPVFYYGHGSGPTVGCAITGGAFYNPATRNFPFRYLGKYFFADYCSGWIRVLNTTNYTASDFASGIASPVDLQVGPEGYLYYLARGNGGQVYKVWYTADYPPVGTIIAPAAGKLYYAGQTIYYLGRATDAEDGPLPGSAMTWRVDFHHDGQADPFLPPVSGSRSGSFQIPNTGETSANVFYRIYLTVTDSGGQMQTTFRDILPRTVNTTLAASPAGLRLLLDGQVVTAPHLFTGVVGMRRTIGAPTPQRLGGTWHVFQSWSDGGAATHTITTPAADATYTATYQPAGGAPP